MKRISQPQFLSKSELASELRMSMPTLDVCIANGTIPPPHSRLSPRSVIWLRKHFEAFVETGKWPHEAFTVQETA